MMPGPTSRRARHQAVQALLARGRRPHTGRTAAQRAGPDLPPGPARLVLPPAGVSSRRALIRRPTSLGLPRRGRSAEAKGNPLSRIGDHPPATGSSPGAEFRGVEGLMTANKHFKRRVRERARRTGESYTTALRHLRRKDAREYLMQWQRIEKSDFGYAVHVPAGWDERAPDLQNSPFETARFAGPASRRHSVIVFRGPLPPGAGAAQLSSAGATAGQLSAGQPSAGQLSADEPSADRGSAAVWVAERTQAVLAAAGFGDFEITGTEVGGHAGARLDCARPGAGRTWTVREYFVIRDGVRFVLGCGSYAPDEDDSLFAAIAERFEILSPA